MMRKIIPETEKESLRIIIEKNADSILIIDKKGTVLFINPATEKLFARRKKDFVGESFGFPLIGDDAKEINVVRKGGGVVEAQMRMVQIKWEGKDAYLATVRDITELKRAQQLTGEIRERELREEELRKENKRLLEEQKRIAKQSGKKKASYSKKGFSKKGKASKKLFSELQKRYNDFMDAYLGNDEKKTDKMANILSEAFFQNDVSTESIIGLHIKSVKRFDNLVNRMMAQRKVYNARSALLMIMTKYVSFLRASRPTKQGG